MPGTTTLPPKPRSQVIHPGMTRLPSLSVWRRVIRYILFWLVRFVVWVCVRVEAHGLENLPSRGPALVVANHLGDADLVVGIAYSPYPIDSTAKAELYDFPIIGSLLRAYGVIWVHRGQPDRRALRAITEGLKEGRLIAIAPEGRESLTGALEEGTGGAAYLALKAKVPLLPITFTGTENKRVYDNLKHLRRSKITITVGSPFRIDEFPDRHKAIEVGTQKIMRTLAAQLPPEYRGVYKTSLEHMDGRG
jgi:1-acyl-sn-glycerol-3-phosphate acyltransferase